MTKLTIELLNKLGFRGEGRNIINTPAYRLKVPFNAYLNRHYHYQIQIVLGDYPETNGNSGILSLYDPGVKDAHCLIEERDGDEKADHILWEDKEDNLKGGIKYIDIPSRCIAIAWHVTTLERLNAIYCALTGNEPLSTKEYEKEVKLSSKNATDIGL